jgi:aminoglycoside 6'-N-acetyltransferase I
VPVPGRNLGDSNEPGKPPSAVRPAVLNDAPAVGRMRALLWPESSVEEHSAEASAIVTGESGSTLPVVIFVAETSAGVAGFIEVGLRSHADGCDVSRPVGFVEGWFVDEHWRGQGIGRQLIAAAEAWARGQGCLEMASDTWIDNEASQRAHEALGYEVVDRCVNFRKALVP